MTDAGDRLIKAAKEARDMTEAKHTPGPLVVGYGGGITGPTTPATSGAVCGGRDWPVTLVTRGTETIGIFPDQDNGKGSPLIGTGEAAATLFAAAPDLLEALELADAALSGANMNMRAVYRAVRAAIAKAKGEAT